MTSKLVEIDGVRLEYAWYGPTPGEATTLILLHEGLGCVAMWRDFPEKLSAATGCGVLVYSRQGYGASDACDLPRPVSFMHHEGQSVLPGLIKALGVQEHVLVGHSDGGSIVLINAGSAATEGLKGVVTLAAHVFVEDISVSSIAAIKTVFETTGMPDKLARYHGDNTVCAFWGWNGVWLDPEFRDWNIEEFLSEIEVPVLALQGVNDEYGTPDQIDSIKRNIGISARTIMLDDCGHSPQKDQPDATLRAIAGFVNRVSPAVSSTKSLPDNRFPS
ncbi:MAG: alpha/beta hydrolase [Alphaproteobacteria bacterium]|jgi:pimeloyl-ACP methyl ester carboxylesterase|nr:alpha/beta hydrolase [Alphaproteobacteria bacterium]MBT4082448.1 alpha/beta hydrolase [Alphaproteobacteria bacterium]MBT4545990.1 alpha/beta hydrolase [Alphaproteobacteria bacterium]MBT7743890.1 alpha/beta hydrolase [Alphaproteobacteria bacterium]